METTRMRGAARWSGMRREDGHDLIRHWQNIHKRQAERPSCESQRRLHWAEMQEPWLIVAILTRLRNGFHAIRRPQLMASQPAPGVQSIVLCKSVKSVFRTQPFVIITRSLTNLLNFLMARIDINWCSVYVCLAKLRTGTNRRTAFNCCLMHLPRLAVRCAAENLACTYNTYDRCMIALASATSGPLLAPDLLYHSSSLTNAPCSVE